MNRENNGRERRDDGYAGRKKYNNGGERQERKYGEAGGEHRPRRNYNQDDRPADSRSREGGRSFRPERENGERRYTPFNRDSKPRYNSDRSNNRQERSESAPKRLIKRHEDNNSGRREYSGKRYGQGNDNREQSVNSGWRERKEHGSYHDNQKREYNRNDQEKRPYSRERNDSFRPKKEFRPRTDRQYMDISEEQKHELRQKHYSKKKQLEHRVKNESEDSELRLNRYISMGGVCSRRDADALITQGRVKVNGEVVQSVGVKVNKKDRVEVDGNVVTPERKIYLVLNKPKDYVTTVEDPLERKTVMALIEGACKERIYPIGRLDRMTTGVLLFTNDGDLAKKLTHPKYNHKKIYHVFLDKTVTEEHMQAILKGIELEDGFINADDIRYASDNLSEVGIEIHSGKNRIVRRIFEHFGYQILKLDRVYFAGITKKRLPRGQWRFLTPEEVNMLKFY